MPAANEPSAAARRTLLAAAAAAVTGAVVAPAAGSVGDVRIDDLGPDVQSLIGSKVAGSEKGAVDGVAALDGAGRVPRDQLYFAARVGETNSTSAIQALLDADESRYHRVQLDEGEYVAEGLRIPTMCSLEGAAGGTSRFESLEQRWGGVTIRRPSGSTSTDPIIAVDGAGAGVRNLTLYSGATSATALEVSGFESDLDSIRIISGEGIGLDVALANNPRWRFIYVDNHGSDTLPAVRIRSSPVGVSTTNNVSIYDLTIERSANTALEIGPDALVEWLRFYGLHIENPRDGRGEAYAGNIAPLITVGNARRIDVLGGMLFGGPGPIIRHDQRDQPDYGSGGIKLTNVTLLGSDDSPGTDANRGPRAATPVLVELARGDDFSAENCAFLRYTEAAVSVAAAYGSALALGTSNTFSGAVAADARASSTVLTSHGHHLVDGQLRIGGGEPSVQPGGVNAVKLGAAAADSAGKVFFGTGTTTAAGVLFTVEFAQPFERAPIVTVSAANAEAAALGLYADAGETALTVYALNRPAPGRPDGSFAVNYIAIG
ncbi:hypothetical protein HQQ80_07115 [Microbacteriaceae bacterium VKM Ac-2855]|nr:hypothetical protein [Microbacteriaceae bacterium VKM Ac-2855]